MTEIASSQQVFSRIEFFLRQAKYEYAEALLFQLLNQDPSDRESKLYLLLINVTREGPVLYEEDIDQLRNLCDLNDTEKEIVRRLFVLGFRSAEREGREDQVWAYQRLLRRLLLNQPLDPPIPRSSGRIPPAHQERARKLIDRALIPIHNPNLARVGDKAISLGWFVAFLENTSSRCQIRFHLALQNARNLSASQQVALAIAAVALFMVPIGYFSLPPAHPVKETSGYADAALSQPKLANSVLAVSGIPLSQHSDDAENTKKERIHNMVAHQLPSLQRAYGRWIRENGNLMGSLLVKLELDAAGNVIKVEEVASRITDSEFREVVLAEVRKWKFRNANFDTAEFTVPLLFVPKDMDSETILRWERTLNSSEGEANAILPVHVTSLFADGEEPRSTIKVNPSSADLKFPKAVEADGSKTKNPEGPPEQEIAYRTRRVAPLRQEPRFAAATTQDIDAGVTISVLEAKGDWLKVKTRPSGTVGYVRKEYVAPAGAPQ